MQDKNQVGQILLTHPKDTNFTTLYEEAFSKQGETVELFAVIEISDGETGQARPQHAECQKLAATIIGAFKKSYVESHIIDEDAFERSLAAVNSSLARALSRGKVNWFGKLNVCLAALYQGELSLSVTGTAQALLLRGHEMTSLSSDLAETKTKPVKIFGNYTSGKLATRDRVILTQNQLFNYLAPDRIQECLMEDTLDECCQSIISALADTKNMGFATFICEIGTAKQSSEIFSPTIEKPQVAKTGNPILAVASAMLKWAALALWTLAASLTRLIARLFQGRAGARPQNPTAHRSKRKFLFVAIAVVAVLFLANIGYGYVKKNLLSQVKTGDEQLTKIEQLLDGADAALIYKDQKKVVKNVEEAEKLLAESKGNKPNEKWTTLDGRLQELKNKINKSTKVENAVALASFPNVPTDLLRSPDGILAWNRDSGSFAMYDFRTGTTKGILKNENTSGLVAGAYIGQPFGFVFLRRDGQFVKLDPTNEKITPFDNPPADPNLAGNEIRGGVIGFGTGTSARLYLIDTVKNQIWRFRATTTGINASDKWLKTESVDMSSVVDQAVDGSIYLLSENGVDKYFNGAKADWELAPLTPGLQKAAAIFTTDTTQSIYILDPANQRILVFDKTGQLQNQLTSDKFHDAADLYVDETAKIIYVLSGSDLLRINY